MVMCVKMIVSLTRVVMANIVTGIRAEVVVAGQIVMAQSGDCHDKLA
jgi:hypothetical protein